MDLNFEQLAELPADNQKQVTRKQVLAIGKLVESIDKHSATVFDLQRVTGHRLEDLAKSINDFNEKSGDLAKRANVIAVVIAVSAIIQLVVTVLRK
jgi:hypothetical protein